MIRFKVRDDTVRMAVKSASVSFRVGDAVVVEKEVGVVFTTDETLNFDPETKVLSVNRAEAVEADNTLPITSAAVHTTVGNIEILLQTI